MKVKNTKELRLRALAHARADHVAQGTYGSAVVNGSSQYEGCAVSCLATPHRKREFRQYVIKHGYEHDGYFYADFGGPEQQQRVAEEFGIHPSLMILGEGFFETQKTHGAAIEFIKNFALAFNEGATFTPSKIDRWVEEHFGIGVHDFSTVVEYFYSGRDFYGSPNSHRREEMTQEFLDWIKGIRK